MPRRTLALFAALLLAPACATRPAPQPPAPLIVVQPSGAPTEAEILAALNEAHARFASDTGGKNADYIPALARVDSGLFGISLVTVDGRRYDVGDSASAFSIQSISKVFTLAEVMQQRGDDAVVEKIGVDATGEAFNSIAAIERIETRSVNPFVNAGAIATVSLVEAKDADERWDLVLDNMSRFAGRELTVDEEVYRSEAATNGRNQAIAKLLQAYDRLYADPATTVDVYTRQCAISVTSHDLAVMGATLANGGVNPITGARALDAAYVPRILAVMSTAGLYDTTGSWMWKVGLPAKSGVGGGIVAVAPGRFGIAAFSPPLDAAGNSVRAQKAIEYVAGRLGVSVFKP